MNFESQFCCVRIFFILLQALIEKVVVCLLPLLGGGGRREKPSGVDTQKTYQPFYHCWHFTLQAKHYKQNISC